MSTLMWDKAHLETLANHHGWTLHHTQTIDSTNTALLNRAQHAPIHRHWWITDEQYQGRGRHGNVWYATPGSTLLTSFSWTLLQPLHRATQGVSLVVGLCIIQALQSLTTEARLKWPNDILLNGKKLAGILIETTKSTRESTTLIIGLGLNWCSPSTDILPDSIGLDTVCPKLSETDRYAFLNTLLRQLDAHLQYFGEDGFAPFRYDWVHYHAWAVGTPVRWDTPQEMCEGYLDTLDEFGQLWVVQSHGQRIPLGEHAYTLRPRKELL